MRMQPQNVVVVLRSCCCCCCCLRVFGAQLGLCCCNRTINAAAQHEPSPVRVRVLCVCEGTRTGFAFSLLPLSLLSALLFFCGSLQFGLVSLLRSFGRRRRSSRRHHGASLSLSPSLSLSCTQIMAFAKLDPGSFSGFLLLLLLLLSASLV